ncbi:hypothetical protein BGX23_007358 [Mortierella sp. AD031]|nr:hypothetical protein BGX23_007358 [Mortierella sp. AD031]
MPRQRSMSTSFCATSPVATFSGSSGINHNPFFNPIISPSSVSSTSGPGGGGGGAGANATPASTLASLSSSIPSSLNRRFSANFTNPLTINTATSPTSIASQDDRGRRQSLFGSSPPLSRHLNDIHEPTFSNATPHTSTAAAHPHDSTDTGGGGGGGGGGIGGLFRKFSVSGRSSGAGNVHPTTTIPDRNEPGPVSANTHQGGPLLMAHVKAVDALKPPASQKDQISRSSSPMRSMILNGQMLD